MSAREVLTFSLHQTQASFMQDSQAKCVATHEHIDVILSSCGPYSLNRLKAVNIFICKNTYNTVT